MKSPTVVVVGNGPSLRGRSLPQSSNDRLVFACNRIHLRSEWGQGWRPSAYFLTDVSKNKEWKQDVALHLAAAEAGGYLAVIDEAMVLECTQGMGGNLPNSLRADHPTLECFSRCGHYDQGQERQDWHFPTLCQFGGAVFVAVQYALLHVAGLTRIEMVGCDGEYRAGISNHFTEVYLGRAYTAQEAKDTNRVLAGARAEAETHCRLAGVDLVKA